MNLYFTVEAPHRWVRMNEDEIDSMGEAAALADIPLMPMPRSITGVVRGEWVATHTVMVPARTRAKMLAAVPYALEEALSADVEDLHFVPVYWKAGEAAIVAVTARQLVRGWLDSCADAGIPVDRLVPDYMLLPMHPATRYTVASLHEGRLLVRSDGGGGIAIDEDFFDHWLDEIAQQDKMGQSEIGQNDRQGDTISLAINDEDLVRRLIAGERNVDARYWDFGTGLGDWLTHKPEGQIDLLTGDFRQKSRTANLSSYRVALIIVACAIGVKLLGDAWLYFSLSAESRRLDQQMAQIITDIFPGVSVIPSREQFIMQQEMDKLLGTRTVAGDYLLFLSAVTRATRGKNVSVEDLTFREGKLTVSCTVSDFGAVDDLQQRFSEDNRISADLASSSASEGKVTGRFILERAI
jgi:general secretion pathway protein L